MLQCLNGLLQTFHIMRRLKKAEHQEEWQFLCGVLCTERRTRRLCRLQLPIANQPADLLRLIGGMIGMTLREDAQHLHIARALLFPRHGVAVLTQQELAHLVHIFVEEIIIIRAALHCLLKRVDLLAQLLHVRRHHRHGIVGNLAVTVVHRFVQDRLSLHNILLDRIGKELALELRIVDEEHIAQRHDVSAVGMLAKGHTEILVLLLRPRSLHEAEHLPKELVQDENEKPHERHRQGKATLCHC